MNKRADQQAAEDAFWRTAAQEITDNGVSAPIHMVDGQGRHQWLPAQLLQRWLLQVSGPLASELLLRWQLSFRDGLKGKALGAYVHALTEDSSLLRRQRLFLAQEQMLSLENIDREQFYQTIGEFLYPLDMETVNLSSFAASYPVIEALGVDRLDPTVQWQFLEVLADSEPSDSHQALALQFMQDLASRGRLIPSVAVKINNL